MQFKGPNGCYQVVDWCVWGLEDSVTNDGVRRDTFWIIPSRFWYWSRVKRNRKREKCKCPPLHLLTAISSDHNSRYAVKILNVIHSQSKSQATLPILESRYSGSGRPSALWGLTHPYVLSKPQGPSRRSSKHSRRWLETEESLSSSKHRNRNFTQHEFNALAKIACISHNSHIMTFRISKSAATYHWTYSDHWYLLIRLRKICIPLFFLLSC